MIPQHYQLFLPISLRLSLKTRTPEQANVWPSCASWHGPIVELMRMWIPTTRVQWRRRISGRNWGVAMKRSRQNISRLDFEFLARSCQKKSLFSMRTTLWCPREQQQGLRPCYPLPKHHSNLCPSYGNPKLQMERVALVNSKDTFLFCFRVELYIIQDLFRPAQDNRKIGLIILILLKIYKLYQP